jgi:hypothetical protein
MGAASGVATPVNATLAAVLEPFREGAR